MIGFRDGGGVWSVRGREARVTVRVQYEQHWPDLCWIFSEYLGCPVSTSLLDREPPALANVQISKLDISLDILAKIHVRLGLEFAFTPSVFPSKSFELRL